MKLDNLKDKTILILGFGREGKITQNFLKEHSLGKVIETADKSDGGNYLEKLKDYDVIIKSPGIPYLPQIKEAQREGKIVTSATQIFFDNFKGKIIGVTGTKGKSTTASLVYEILNKAGLDAYLVGNIGKPSLELLDQTDQNSIAVYELSSFQLEDLKVSPHIAVITNIYPEHLDHHGSLENYVESKSNIAKFQTENDYLIYNADNKRVVEIAKLSKAKNKYGFSIKDRTEFIQDIPLVGRFNLNNVVAAEYVGKIFDIPGKKIKEAIEQFKPLSHRLEFIGEFGQIKFYNDSLATIPQATVGALKALGGDVETLIAGGFDRGIDYSVLGEEILRSNVKNLILFPDTGKKIWNSLKNENCKLKIKKYDVDSMKKAVELAYKYTSPEKIVLLSPASSSFNLFKNYADRGDQFKKYTELLGKPH